MQYRAEAEKLVAEVRLFIELKCFFIENKINYFQYSGKKITIV